ncbi:TonB-dependent receptor [Cereibacter sphaeroides]|nr:TonB-dependent receptor [Cereibacter sphaeroides]
MTQRRSPSRPIAAGLSGSTALALIATLAMAPLPAAAQEGDSVFQHLGRIILRGEGLVRRIESTAASAELVDQDEIEGLAPATTVTEAISDVPNVLTYGASGVAPTIRGQDTQGPSTGALAFFGGTTPRASIVQDGRVLNYNEYVYGGSNAWDVEGIEVYRGPQTIAQGANSIAGAVIVHSNRPSFTREGAVRAEVGTNGARRLSFAYSDALSEDLAYRISVDRSQRDNVVTYSNPAFTQRDHIDTDIMSQTARASLLWRPADIDGLEVQLTFSHSRSSRPTSEAAMAPFEDLVNTGTSMPVFENENASATLAITQDFGTGWVLSSTTVLSRTQTNRLTYPYTVGSADIDADNVSNETRLTFGEDGDPVFGTMGVYLNGTDQVDYLYSGYESLFDDRRRSAGVFGEVTVELGDRWSLGAGLRYQRDEIQRSGTAYIGSPAIYGDAAVDFDATYDAWLPRISLAYEVNEGLTLGGLVSRGYNPGGVTLNFTTGQYVEYAPEYLTNYELFARANLLGGALRLNANLFQLDMTDAQRFVAVNVAGTPQSYTVNAERARSRGFEMSADWDVSDRFRMNAGLGLLQTEFLEFSALPARVGNAFAMAPEYTLTLGASYEFANGLTLSGQVRHVAGYFSEDANSTAYEIEPLTLANLRLDYEMRNGMTVYGYVSNVFDVRQPTYLQMNRVIGGLEGYMTRPREIGIGLSYTF